jgi:hypothetical protein
VGDEDRGHVDVLVQPPQPGAELLAHARVECPEGLVEEQHLGLHRERPRQGHALALAAGELRGVALGEAVEMHERQQLLHPGGDLGLRALANLQAEGDVVGHSHVLEGGVVLEDEAHVAALGGQRGGVLAGDQHPALVGLLEPRDHTQEGRLPAPARPQEGRERPLGDVHRHVLDGGEVAEALAYSVDDDAHVRSPSWA